MEGVDAVFGALRWRGQRWDGSGVPVVFDCGGDDLLGLFLQDDVALTTPSLPNHGPLP